MTNAAWPYARAAAVVRWGVPSGSFELAASDARVTDRARVVFGPWRSETQESAAPRVRFRIRNEAGDPGGRWRVEWGNGDAAIAPTLDQAVTAVEYRSIVELLDPSSGIVALHAALLSKDGRAVVVVGPKESGKSTFACALWRAGWQLHSDDAAVIEDGHRARGVPRRVSLRAAARKLVGDALWERIATQPATSRTSTGILFHPDEESRRDAPAPVHVAGIAFLGRRGSTAGPAEIVHLDGASALLGMAPYCHREDLALGVPLRILQPLAHHARAFDVGRGDLAQMVARVEEAVAS